MRRYGALILWLLVLVIGAVFVIPRVLESETWTREHPLAHPTSVVRVSDGSLELADGRHVRPAGVVRASNVSPAEYDQALDVIIAQGVESTRDLGDGTAFMMVEPKFYNWCGTRGFGGNPWGHWAGGYFQLPLSEVLIAARLAEANVQQTGLTSRERWRLEGASRFDLELCCGRTDAFRFDTTARQLGDYEFELEVKWKPPPND